LLLDESTLQGMADLTGGAYYRAEDANQLYNVFRDLPTEIVMQRERLEISVFLALLGAVFAIAAVALALIWHRSL
jgi:Ca-activated chloride channel family protein